MAYSIHYERTCQYICFTPSYRERRNPSHVPIPLKPTHPHTIANLEIRMFARLSAQLGDDAYTFVPEPHGRVAVVLICAADAAVRDLDDCFRGAGCARAAGGDDVAGFGTFEDGEGRCHCGCGVEGSGGTGLSLVRWSWR